MADPGRYDLDINHNLIPQYGAAKGTSTLSASERLQQDKIAKALLELKSFLGKDFAKFITSGISDAISKSDLSKGQKTAVNTTTEKAIVDSIVAALDYAQRKQSFGSSSKGTNTGAYQNPETFLRMVIARLGGTFDNVVAQLAKQGINLPPELVRTLKELAAQKANKYGGQQLDKTLRDLNTTTKSLMTFASQGIALVKQANKLVSSDNKLELTELPAFIKQLSAGQAQVGKVIDGVNTTINNLKSLSNVPKDASNAILNELKAVRTSLQNRSREANQKFLQDPMSVIRDMSAQLSIAVKKADPSLGNSKMIQTLDRLASAAQDYKNVEVAMKELTTAVKDLSKENFSDPKVISQIFNKFQAVKQELPFEVKLDKVKNPTWEKVAKQTDYILKGFDDATKALETLMNRMDSKKLALEIEPEIIISDTEIKKAKHKLEKELSNVVVEPKTRTGFKKSPPPTQEFMHSQKTNRLREQVLAKTRGEAPPPKHSQDDINKITDSLSSMLSEVVVSIKTLADQDKVSPAVKTISDELSKAIESNQNNPLELLKVLKNVLEAKDQSSKDLLNNVMAGTDVKIKSRLQEINTLMRAYSPKTISSALGHSKSDGFMGKGIRISNTKPFGPSTATDVYKYPTSAVKPARPQQTKLDVREGEEEIPNAAAARRMVEANAKDLANSLLDLQHHIVTTLEKGFKDSKSGWKIVRKGPEQEMSEYFKLVKGYNKKTAGKQYSVQIADIEGLRMQLGNEAIMQRKYGISGQEAYDPGTLIKSFKKKVFSNKMRNTDASELPEMIADWVHKFSEDAIQDWDTLPDKLKGKLLDLKKSKHGQAKGTAPSQGLIDELGKLLPSTLKDMYEATVNEIEANKMLTEPIGNRISPLVREISVPAARMSATGAHIFETQQGSQRIIPKFAKYKTGFESLYEKMMETETIDVTKGYQGKIRGYGIRPSAAQFTEANEVATGMLTDLAGAKKNKKQIRQDIINQFKTASILRTDELISQKHLKEADRAPHLAKADELLGSKTVSDFVAGKDNIQEVMDAFKKLGVSAYDVAKSMEQVEFRNIYEMFDQLLQGSTKYNRALQDLAKSPHLDSAVREYETYMRKLVGTIPIADPTRPRRFAHQEKVINLQSMTSPIFSDGVSEMRSDEQKQYIRDLNLNLREYVKSTDVLSKAGDKSRKLPEDVRTISSLGVPEAQAATLSDYRYGARGDDAYLSAFNATNLKMYTDVLPELSPFGAQFQQLGRNIASTTNALAFRPAGGIGTEFPSLRSAREQEMIAGGRHGDQGYGFNVVAELRNTASTFEDQIVISGKLADVLTSVTKTLIQPDKMGALQFLSGKGIVEPASGSVSDIQASQILVDIDKVNKVFQEVLGVKQEYRGRADKALIAEVEKAITVVRGKSLNVQVAKIAETFFNYYGRKFTTRYGSKGVAISPAGGMEMTGKEVAKMFDAPVKVLSEKEREKAGLGSALLPKSMGELSREIFLNNRRALEKAGIGRAELAELNQSMVRSGNKFILSMFTDADLGVAPAYETKLQQELYEKVKDAFASLNINLGKDFGGIEAIQKAYKSNVPKGALYEETPIDIRISSFGLAKRGLQTENLETIMNNIIDAGKSGSTVLKTEFDPSVYKRMLGTEGGDKNILNLSAISEALGFRGAEGTEGQITKDLFELLKARGTKGTDEEIMKQAKELAALETRSNFYSQTIDEFGKSRQSLVGPKFVEVVEDPHANPAWSETDIEKQIKGERLNLPATAAYATIFGQDSAFMKEMMSSVPLDTKKHYEYVKALQVINDSASEMAAGLLKSAQRLDVSELKAFVNSTGTLAPGSEDEPDSLLNTILDVRKFPGAINLQIPDTQSPGERESFYVPGGLARTIYPEATMAGQYGMDNISRRLQHVVNTAKNLDAALSGDLETDTVGKTKGRIINRLRSYREQAESITFNDPTNKRAGFKDYLSKEERQELEAILGKMYKALGTTQIDPSYLTSSISDPDLNRADFIKQYKGQQMRFNKESKAYQTTIGAAVDLLVGHRPGEREELMAKPDNYKYKKMLLKRYDAPTVLSNAEDLGGEAVKKLAKDLYIEPAAPQEDEIKYRVKKLEQAKIEYYNALAESALGKTGSVQELLFSRKVPAVMAKAINAVVDKTEDLDNFSKELEKISKISGTGVDLGSLSRAADSIKDIRVEHAAKITDYKKKGMPVLKQHELGIPENYAEKLPVTFSKRFSFKDDQMTKFGKPKLVKSNLSEMMKYRDELFEATQGPMSESLRKEIQGHMDTDLTPFIESVRYPFTGTSSVQPYEAKILRPGEGRQFEKHSLMAPGIPDMDTDAFDAIKKQTEAKLDELYERLEKEQSEDEPNTEKIAKLIKTIEMLDKAISDVIPKYIAQQQKLDFDGDQIEIHSAKTAKARKEIEGHYKSLTKYDPKKDATARAFRDQFTYDAIQPSTGKYTLAEQQLAFQKKFKKEEGFGFLEKPFLTEKLDYLDPAEKLGILASVPGAGGTPKGPLQALNEVIPSVFRNPQTIDDVMATLRAVETPLNQEGEVDQAAYIDALLKALNDLNTNIANVVNAGVSSELFDTKYLNTISAQLFKINTGPDTEALNRLLKIFERNIGYGAGTIGAGQAQFEFSDSLANRFPTNLNALGPEMGKELHTMINELVRIGIQKGLDVKHAGEIPIATEITNLIAEGRSGVDKLIEKIAEGQGAYGDIGDFAAVNKKRLSQNLSKLSTKDLSFDAREIAAGRGENISEAAWRKMDRGDLKKYIIDSIGFEGFLYELSDQVFEAARQGIKTDVESWSPEVRAERLRGMDVDTYVQKQIKRQINEQGHVNVLTSAERPLMPLYKHRTSSMTTGKEREINKLRHNEMQVTELQGIFTGNEKQDEALRNNMFNKYKSAKAVSQNIYDDLLAFTGSVEKQRGSYALMTQSTLDNLRADQKFIDGLNAQLEVEGDFTATDVVGRAEGELPSNDLVKRVLKAPNRKERSKLVEKYSRQVGAPNLTQMDRGMLETEFTPKAAEYVYAKADPAPVRKDYKSKASFEAATDDYHKKLEGEIENLVSKSIAVSQIDTIYKVAKTKATEGEFLQAFAPTKAPTYAERRQKLSRAAAMKLMETSTDTRAGGFEEQAAMADSGRGDFGGGTGRTALGPTGGDAVNVYVVGVAKGVGLFLGETREAAKTTRSDFRGFSGLRTPRKTLSPEMQAKVNEAEKIVEKITGGLNKLEGSDFGVKYRASGLKGVSGAPGTSERQIEEIARTMMGVSTENHRLKSSSLLGTAIHTKLEDKYQRDPKAFFANQRVKIETPTKYDDPRAGEISGTMDVIYRDVQGQTQKIVDVKTTSEKNFNELKRAIEEFREKTGKETPSLEEIKSYIKSSPYLKNQKMDEVASQLNLYLKAENEGAEAEAHFYSALNTDYDDPLVLKQSFDPERLERDMKAIQTARRKVQDLQASGKGRPFAKTASYEEAKNIKAEEITDQELDTLFKTATEYYKLSQGDQSLAASRTSLGDEDLSNIAMNTRKQRAYMDAFDDMIRAMPSTEGSGVVGVDRALREMHQLSKDYLRQHEGIDVEGEGVKQFVQSIQDLLKRITTEGPKGYTFSEELTKLKDQGAITQPGVNKAWKAYRIAVGDYFVSQIEKSEAAVRDDSVAKGSTEQVRRFNQYKDYVNRFQKNALDAMGKKTDIYTTEDHRYIAPDAARRAGVLLSSEQLVNKAAGPLQEDDDLKALFKRMVSFGEEEEPLPRDAIRDALTTLLGMDKALIGLYTDLERVIQLGPKLDGVFEFSKAKSGISRLREQLAALLQFSSADAYSSEQRKYLENVLVDLRAIEKVYSRLDFNQMSTGRAGIDGRMPDILPVNKNLAVNEQRAVSNFNLRRLHDYYSTTEGEGGPTKGDTYRYSAKTYGPGGRVASEKVHTFIKYGEVMDDAGNKSSVFNAKVKDLTKTMAEGNRTFRIAVERVIKWGAAATLVYGGFRYLREAVDHISDVEVAMARLQMVMNPIETDFDKLKMSAIEFAKQYGVGVESVLAGMRVFAQQGLGQEEVLKRTQTSVVASNITDLSSTDATEALTAAMKVFRSEGENSMRFLDAWSNVESKAAITAGDLANAIKKSASAAANAGITFDQLNGMVAAIGSVTRQTGKEVGTSLRFIFRRLSSEKGPNVLKNLGIDVNTTKGTLKPGFQILDELAGKWDGLTRANKLAVAQAIGGTRQYNSVLVLLDHWKSALDNVKNSVDSKGTAERKNLVLMKTFAKQMEQLKASASELKLEFGKLVLPSFKAGVSGLKFIVESINNIPSSVKLAAASFALLATWVVKGANWMNQLTTMMDKSKITFSEFSKDFRKQMSAGMFEVFGAGNKNTDPDLFGLKSVMKDPINDSKDLTSSLGKLAAAAMTAGRSYNAFLGMTGKNVAGAGDVVGDLTSKTGHLVNKIATIGDYIGDFIPGPIDDAIAKTAKWTGRGLVGAGEGTQLVSQLVGDKASLWLDAFATSNAGVVKSLLPLTASLGGLALVLPKLKDGYVKLAGTASDYRDQQNAKLDVQQKELDKIQALIAGYNNLETAQKRIANLQGEPGKEGEALERRKEALEVGEYKSPLLAEIQYAEDLSKVLKSLTTFDNSFLVGMDNFGNPLARYGDPKEQANDLRGYLKELERVNKIQMAQGQISIIGKYVDELTTTDGIQEWKYQLKELAEEVPVIGEMIAKGISVGPAKALEVINEDINKIISARNQNPLSTTFDKTLEKRLTQQKKIKDVFDDTYKELLASVDNLNVSGLKDVSVSNLFNNEALRKTYDLMSQIEQKYKVMREGGETVSGKDILATKLLGTQIPQLANYIEPVARYTTERLAEANIKPINYKKEDVKLQTGQLAVFNKDIAEQYGIATDQAKVIIDDENRIFFKYVDKTLERLRTTREFDPNEIKDLVQLIFPTNAISDELMTKVAELNTIVTGAAAGMVGFTDETLQKRQVDLGERFFSDISPQLLLQTSKGYDPKTNRFGDLGRPKDFIEPPIKTVFNESEFDVIGRKDNFAKEFEENLYAPFKKYTELQAQFRASTAEPGETKQGEFAEQLLKLQKVLANNSVVFQIRSAFEELTQTLSETERAVQKSIAVEKLRQETQVETAGILAGTIKGLAGRDLGVRNYSELTPDQTSILTNQKYVDNAKRLLELDIQRDSTSSALEAIASTMSDIEQIPKAPTAWGSIFTDAQLSERETLLNITNDDKGSTVVALKLNKANDYLAAIKESSKTTAEALMDTGTKKAQSNLNEAVVKLENVGKTNEKGSSAVKGQITITMRAIEKLQKQRDKAFDKGNLVLANQLDNSINKAYAGVLNQTGIESLTQRRNIYGLDKDQRSNVLRRGLAAQNITIDEMNTAILDGVQEIKNDAKKFLGRGRIGIPYTRKGAVDKIRGARRNAEAARNIDVNDIGKASFMAAILATFQKSEYGARYRKAEEQLAAKQKERASLPKGADTTKDDKEINALKMYMAKMEKRQQVAAMAQGVTAIASGAIKAGQLAGTSDASKAKLAIGGIGLYSLVKILGTEAGEGLRKATKDFESNFDKETLQKILRDRNPEDVKDAGKAIYKFVKDVQKQGKELEKVSGVSNKDLKKQMDENKTELLNYENLVELQERLDDINTQVKSATFSKSNAFIKGSAAIAGAGLYGYFGGDELDDQLKRGQKYALEEEKYFMQMMGENPKLAQAYLDTKKFAKDAGVTTTTKEFVDSIKMSLKEELKATGDEGQALVNAFKKTMKKLVEETQRLEIEQALFNSFSDFTISISNMRLELEKGLDSIDTQRILNPTKAMGNILKGFAGDLDLPVYKSELSPSQQLFANGGDSIKEAMTAYTKLNEVLNTNIAEVDMYKNSIRDLEDNHRRATKNQKVSKTELEKYNMALESNRKFLAAAEERAKATGESIRKLGEDLKNLQKLNTIFEELNVALRDISVENYTKSNAGLKTHFDALDKMLGGSAVDAQKIVLPEERRKAAEAGVTLGTTATAQEMEYAQLMSRYTDRDIDWRERVEVGRQIQDLPAKYETLKYEQEQTKEDALFKATLQPYEEMFKNLELYSRVAELEPGSKEFNDVEFLKEVIKQGLVDAKSVLTQDEALKRLETKKDALPPGVYEKKREEILSGHKQLYAGPGAEMKDAFNKVISDYDSDIKEKLDSMNLNKDSFMKSAVTNPLETAIGNVQTEVVNVKNLLEKHLPGISGIVEEPAKEESKKPELTKENVQKAINDYMAKDPASRLTPLKEGEFKPKTWQEKFFYTMKHGRKPNTEPSIMDDYSEGDSLKEKIRSKFAKVLYTAMQDMLDAWRGNLKPKDFTMPTSVRPMEEQKKAAGGRIFGEGGPREDKVPAYLSPGEFVIRAHSAQRLGYSTLDHMNKKGTVPGFADGGTLDKDYWERLDALNEMVDGESETKKKKILAGAPFGFLQKLTEKVKGLAASPFEGMGEYNKDKQDNVSLKSAKEAILKRHRDALPKYGDGTDLTAAHIRKAMRYFNDEEASLPGFADTESENYNEKVLSQFFKLYKSGLSSEQSETLSSSSLTDLYNELVDMDDESVFLNTESLVKKLKESKKSKGSGGLNFKLGWDTLTGRGKQIDEAFKFADGMTPERMKEFYNQPSREISTITGKYVPTAEEIADSGKNAVRTTGKIALGSLDYMLIPGAIKSLIEGGYEFSQKGNVDIVDTIGETLGAPAALMQKLPGMPKPVKLIGKVLEGIDNRFDAQEHMQQAGIDFSYAKLFSGAKDKAVAALGSSRKFIRENDPASQAFASSFQKINSGLSFADGGSLLDKIRKYVQENDPAAKYFTESIQGLEEAKKSGKSRKKLTDKKKKEQRTFLEKLKGFGAEDYYGIKKYDAGGPVRSFVGDASGVMEVSDSLFEQSINTAFPSGTLVKDTLASFGVTDVDPSKPESGFTLGSKIFDATNVAGTKTDLKKYIEKAKANKTAMYMTAIGNDLKLHDDAESYKTAVKANDKMWAEIKATVSNADRSVKLNDGVEQKDGETLKRLGLSRANFIDEGYAKLWGEDTATGVQNEIIKSKADARKAREVKEKADAAKFYDRLKKSTYESTTSPSDYKAPILFGHLSDFADKRIAFRQNRSSEIFKPGGSRAVGREALFDLTKKLPGDVDPRTFKVHSQAMAISFYLNELAGEGKEIKDLKKVQHYLDAEEKARRALDVIASGKDPYASSKLYRTKMADTKVPYTGNYAGKKVTSFKKEKTLDFDYMEDIRQAAEAAAAAMMPKTKYSRQHMHNGGVVHRTGNIFAEKGELVLPKKFKDGTDYDLRGQSSDKSTADKSLRGGITVSVDGSELISKLEQLTLKVQDKEFKLKDAEVTLKDEDKKVTLDTTDAEAKLGNAISTALDNIPNAIEFDTEGASSSLSEAVTNAITTAPKLQVDELSVTLDTTEVTLNIGDADTRLANAITSAIEGANITAQSAAVPQDGGAGAFDLGEHFEQKLSSVTMAFDEKVKVLDDKVEQLENRPEANTQGLNRDVQINTSAIQSLDDKVTSHISRTEQVIASVTRLAQQTRNFTG